MYIFWWFSRVSAADDDIRLIWVELIAVLLSSRVSTIDRLRQRERERASRESTTLNELELYVIELD